MNIILCSINETEYNDETVPAVTRYLTSMVTRELLYVLAVYYKEQGYMKLKYADHEEDITVPEGNDTYYRKSRQYFCNRKIFKLLCEHDYLMMAKISDLSADPEEAAELYLSLLERGIEIRIDDLPMLNSSTVGGGKRISVEMKDMIKRQIKSVLCPADGDKDLSIPDAKIIAKLSKAKKKYGD